jgi:hypothetical protein
MENYKRVRILNVIHEYIVESYYDMNVNYDISLKNNLIHKNILNGYSFGNATHNFHKNNLPVIFCGYYSDKYTLDKFYIKLKNNLNKYGINPYFSIFERINYDETKFDYSNIIFEKFKEIDLILTNIWIGYSKVNIFFLDGRYNIYSDLYDCVISNSNQFVSFTYLDMNKLKNINNIIFYMNQIINKEGQ